MAERRNIFRRILGMRHSILGEGGGGGFKPTPSKEPITNIKHPRTIGPISTQEIQNSIDRASDKSLMELINSVGRRFEVTGTRGVGPEAALRYNLSIIEASKRGLPIENIVARKK